MGSVFRISDLSLVSRDSKPFTLDLFASPCRVTFWDVNPFWGEGRESYYFLWVFYVPGPVLGPFHTLNFSSLFRSGQ